MRKYELNRKTYKEIRKMDHGQMSLFCEKLYMKGYADGKTEAAGLSETEVMKTILQVKGIGEKKAQSIVQALTQAQKEMGGVAHGQE